MADKYKYFKIEAGEILAELTANLLALEKSPKDRKLTKLLLRLLHSLKGAAGVVQLSEMSRLSHAMEGRLIRIQNQNRAICTEEITALLDATTLLGNMLEAVKMNTPENLIDSSKILALLNSESNGSPSEARNSTEPKKHTTGKPIQNGVTTKIKRPVTEVHRKHDVQESEDAVIRIKTADLDRMTTFSNEILINAVWLKDTIALLGKTVRELGHMKSTQPNRTALEKSVYDLEQKITSSVAFSREMVEAIRATHLVPVRQLSYLFEKAVRDLALKTGKSIRFSIKGSEKQFSRFLLDRIREPLFHIVRNSVVHGIETARERELSRKKATGTIQLLFEKEMGLAHITCYDDGRGMDTKALRKKAVEKKIITAEAAAAMSDEDALYLTLQSGLSSVGEASELAGRGVGLDVVKECVSNLGGSVAIESKQNVFSRFTLKLPLSADVLSAFLIQISEQNYLIPFRNVVGTLQIGEEDILWETGKSMIQHNGAPIPLVELRELLQLPPAAKSTGKAKVVLVKSNLDTAGLIVDRLVNRIEIMPKPLQGELAKLVGIRSSAILSNGDPAFVLNVGKIIEKTQKVDRKKGENQQEKSKSLVMIVDDSQTTRLMIDGILRSEGYETMLAQSGEEALEILTDKTFDLFVTDVQMPGISGFELAERLRNFEEYKEVPIVILSSLGSEEDKRHGITVGANAYFVKGQFVEKEFISTIESLLL